MLFNNTIKWIDAFVPMDIELVKGSEKATEGSKKAEEGSSKRATSNLEQEDVKRQRIKEENESAELKDAFLTTSLGIAMSSPCIVRAFLKALHVKL
nr:hypothetical protein [Tanacetum cinerariifolium]